jgi:hypothetical protein
MASWVEMVLFKNITRFFQNVDKIFAERHQIAANAAKICAPYKRRYIPDPS